MSDTELTEREKRFLHRAKDENKNPFLYIHSEVDEFKDIIKQAKFATLDKLSDKQPSQKFLSDYDIYEMNGFTRKEAEAWCEGRNFGIREYDKIIQAEKEGVK